MHPSKDEIIWKTATLLYVDHLILLEVSVQRSSIDDVTDLNL